MIEKVKIFKEQNLVENLTKKIKYNYNEHNVGPVYMELYEGAAFLFIVGYKFSGTINPVLF